MTRSGVEALGLDETALQAASATRSTSFVTGIVDLTATRAARLGCSTWSKIAVHRRWLACSTR